MRYDTFPLSDRQKMLRRDYADIGGSVVRDRVYGNSGEFTTHGYKARSGAASGNYDCPAGQNHKHIQIFVNTAGLGSGVTMTALAEGSQDGGTSWRALGSVFFSDVLAKCSGTNPKTGEPNNPLWLRITEGLESEATFLANGYQQSHKLVNPEDGAVYYQRGFEQLVRVTVTTSASVNYSVSQRVGQQKPPPAPIGRHSASLLGTFAAAESAGATTTGSRTTTSGSLITGTPSVWTTSGAATLDACTDSFTNTYTLPSTAQVNFNDGVAPSGDSSVGLSYNIGGTRGASHTVSHVDEGSSNALGAQEWDGIEASPTVAVNTATGSGTAVSVSQAVSASSLVILVMGYDGTSATTFDGNGSSTGQKIDENNDQQDCGVFYNVAQTGSPNIAATLAASRTWGALFVSFTESAAAPGGALPPLPFGGAEPALAMWNQTGVF